MVRMRKGSALQITNAFPAPGATRPPAQPSGTSRPVQSTGRAELSEFGNAGRVIRNSKPDRARGSGEQHSPRGRVQSASLGCRIGGSRVATEDVPRTCRHLAATQFERSCNNP